MRYAIIGAGLAGLTAAWQLHRDRPDAEIDVFEATDRIGGKLHTVPFSSGPTDMGAEAFLARHREAVDFFGQLGLAGRIVHPGGLRSAVLSGGELKELPTRTVMGIPPTGAELAHVVDEATVRRIDAEGEREDIDWPGPGGDMNVGALVRDRYGDQVVDRVVTALLGGVYSCSADDLGLRATVTGLAVALDGLQAEGQRVTLSGAVRRVLRARPEKSDAEVAPVFGTFRGGYRELYEALAEQSGARIHIDAFVAGLRRDADGRLRVEVPGGPDTGAYDAVLVATPAPTTARLLREPGPQAAEPLSGVRLAGSAVVGMHFDSDAGLPQRTGVLVAADEPGMRAKAFTLSSRKWPHLAERGGALVRASFGRYGDEELVRADEDDLVDIALDDLQRATGFDGRAAGLSEIYVQRWHGGLPRFDEHHLARVGRVREAVAQLPGIEVAGAWAAGVGVPAVIMDARAAARRLQGGE